MQEARAARNRRRPSRWLAAGLAAASLAAAAAARADEYDPQRAGHPLRIVAYLVHPLGVFIDYALLRPAHWVGNQEPFRTIFGHTEEM
jgi:hypothetical protein